MACTGFQGRGQVGVPVADELKRLPAVCPQHSLPHGFRLADVLRHVYGQDRAFVRGLQGIQHGLGAIAAAVVDEAERHLGTGLQEPLERRHVQPVLLVVTGDDQADVRHSDPCSYRSSRLFRAGMLAVVVLFLAEPFTQSIQLRVKLRLGNPSLVRQASHVLAAYHEVSQRQDHHPAQQEQHTQPEQNEERRKPAAVDQLSRAQADGYEAQHGTGLQAASKLPAAEEPGLVPAIVSCWILCHQRVFQCASPPAIASTASGSRKA